MRHVIIESPFSSGTPVSIPAVVERNIRYARACLRAALLRGDAPYASHLLYTQEGVLDDTVPEERKLGMEAGWAWTELLAQIRSSQVLFGNFPVPVVVLVHVDLGISSGMTAGVARAEKWGLPIKHIVLGGYWGKCDTQKCTRPASAPGPGHAYGCPLWRIA